MTQIRGPGPSPLVRACLEVGWCSRRPCEAVALFATVLDAGKTLIGRYASTGQGWASFQLRGGGGRYSPSG